LNIVRFSRSKDAIETIAIGKPVKRLHLARFFDNSNYPNFFTEVLPFLQDLALRLPKLFASGLPLLLPQKQATVTISQEQAACLIANAFFGTYSAVDPINTRQFQFPNMQFLALEQGVNPGAMRCILHYFVRIHESSNYQIIRYRNLSISVPKNNIVIERRVLTDIPDWSKSDKKITKMTVSAEGTIEDSPATMHGDFANAFIGGGALEGV
jgi:poly(ADP-ribose) glycohydrolase